MYDNDQNKLRRFMRWTLVLLERLKAADTLLFASVLLAKLYLFNRFLGLPQMKMNGSDTAIETGAILLFCFWTPRIIMQR